MGRQTCFLLRAPSNLFDYKAVSLNSAHWQRSLLAGLQKKDLYLYTSITNRHVATKEVLCTFSPKCEKEAKTLKDRASSARNISHCVRSHFPLPQSWVMAAYSRVGGVLVHND